MERVTRRRLVSLTGVGLALPLAGCSTDADTATPTSPEGSVTIRLRNADEEPRAYRVVVRQGDAVTDEFSGTIPPGADQSVEMIATFRAQPDTQYEFRISTDGGQQGRTWDPTECPDFSVDATIENGAPGFESRCRST